MYNSVIHPLYIVLCVHHPESTFLLSSLIPLYLLSPPPPGNTFCSGGLQWENKAGSSQVWDVSTSGNFNLEKKTPPI